MTGHFEDPAFKVYALTVAVIAVQLIVLAFYTGSVRRRHKVFLNEEDAKFFKVDPGEADHPAVLKVKRAHQNALEASVPFFAVGALYAATAPSRTAALAYFGTFAAVRVAHSFFYLFGKQPFRTISFAIGTLATIGMAFHVVCAAL